jgi:hypothetical protein
MNCSALLCRNRRRFLGCRRSRLPRIDKGALAPRKQPSLLCNAILRGLPASGWSRRPLATRGPGQSTLAGAFSCPGRNGWAWRAFAPSNAWLSTLRLLRLDALRRQWRLVFGRVPPGGLRADARTSLVVDSARAGLLELMSSANVVAVGMSSCSASSPAWAQPPLRSRSI